MLQGVLEVQWRVHMYDEAVVLIHSEIVATQHYIPSGGPTRGDGQFNNAIVLGESESRRFATVTEFAR